MYTNHFYKETFQYSRDSKLLIKGLSGTLCWRIFICLYVLPSVLLLAQDNEALDSLYILEVQDRKEPDKVLHAEPLYIDLIRDLGARKGEKEWNFGFGITDNLNYDTYEALIEYEWAPVNRLGFEIEVPFTFVAKQRAAQDKPVPSDRIEGLKTAVQWSFYVSQKRKTSMALGYINELEFSSLNNFDGPLIQGNIYNPFFVYAKRIGRNFHTLLYTGPKVAHHFNTGHHHTQFDINSNLHYMISGTRNFIGVEVNKTIASKDFDMVIRPQMRLGIADNFLIGILGGIPVERENQRLSMFARIIWEPSHKMARHH